MNNRFMLIVVAVVFALASSGVTDVNAATNGKTVTKAEVPKATDNGAGVKPSEYPQIFEALKAEIVKALPKVNEKKQAAFTKAQDALKSANEAAGAASQSAGRVGAAQGLVDHAKGKWIGGAESNMRAAQDSLNKAKTAAEREAAKAALASATANRDDGLKALKDRQAELDKAIANEKKAVAANKVAQAALAKAQSDYTAAAKALFGDSEPVLGNEKLEPKLVKCALMAAATPAGLTKFAEQGAEQTALVNKLLSDPVLMKQMLVAGGADGGNYGRAMEIYTAIRKASPKSAEGCLQRLALATSLEHALPITQDNTPNATNSAAYVDPVNRYLHYEKAYLADELDPAFKDFSAWEYRMVINCDAPDEILAWGREMLRNYRPDHIYNQGYGWRYSIAVRTDVPYGSRNVKDDLPTNHKYQNIIMNGGVCGRRAFFGRFILRSFGIPTWGVTQKSHAALSHWTPDGWVVNLGAGFYFSWWDKDGAPMSGSDFLLETQARSIPSEYIKVLRSRWVSAILGEKQYNGRRNVPGDYWSNLAQCKAQMIAVEANAKDLGPLGQELGEANEKEEKAPTLKMKMPNSITNAKKLKAGVVEKGPNKVKLSDEMRKMVVGKDGTITIPATDSSNLSGKCSVLKGYSGGMQLNCSGGFKGEYSFTSPREGKYALTAKVATVKTGQTFLFTLNGAKAPVAKPVPYTIGMWKSTEPVELKLARGKNVINVALQDGSRAVSINEFVLTPIK